MKVIISHLNYIKTTLQVFSNRDLNQAVKSVPGDSGRRGAREEEEDRDADEKEWTDVTSDKPDMKPNMIPVIED